MSMIMRGALAVSAATTLWACTTQPTGQGTAFAVRKSDCFNQIEINGFSQTSDRRVVVNTGPREYYLFETFGYCQNLNFAESLGFDVIPSGRICTGLDVTLLVPSTIGTQRCPVRMIKKLSEGERRALN